MGTHNTRRSARMALALAVAALAIAGTSAEAMTPIPVTVTVIQPISFNTLQRGSTHTIDFDSPDAAQFVITAKQNKQVAITVSVEAPETETGGGDGQSRAIPITVAGTHCAYSVDGGDTWIQFTSLTEVVEVPKKQGEEVGEILVRIGCQLNVADDQQRGSYEGAITIDADYADQGENDPGQQGRGSVRGADASARGGVRDVVGTGVIATPRQSAAD
jgi:predicted transglutaminase-like cysteine proteinase